MRRKCIKFREA